jgi:hypothetical protein
MKKKATSIIRICGSCVCPYFYILMMFVFLACGNDGFKSAFQKESGSNPPIPGNSGIISSSYITLTTFDVRWQQASDDTTAASNLQYRVFCAPTHFNSYDEAAATATELTSGWTLGITSLQVTIAAGSGFQWCNVYVRDENGIISAYNGVVPTPYSNTAPVAGGGGSLSVVSSLPLQATITYDKATDLQTPQTSLQYRAYYSADASNVDTFAHASASATLITVGWVFDTAAIQAILPSGGTYWFNVFVMDDQGLITAYTPAQCTVNLKTAPAIPANGLSFTSSSSTITVSWPKASDPDGDTPQNQLQYRVFYSTSSAALNSTSLPTDPLAVEVTLGWTTDWSSSTALSLSVGGLTQGTTYYFNVYVRDYDLMISSYGVIGYNTNAVVPPTPGGSGILVLTRNRDSVNIAWQAASPIATTRYRVYYSTSNNITTYDMAENLHNGIEVTNGWTASLFQINANALTKNTTYYFNVFVISDENAVSAYTSASINLPANTSPVLTSVAPVSSVFNTNFTETISWTKASDDYTPVESLQYRVFFSTVNNGTAYSNFVNSSGIVLVNELSIGWTSDVSAVVTPVLNRNTTYYCNIFVRDSDGLITAYPTAVIAVPASILIPGNSGHIDLISNSSTGYYYLVWTAAVDDFTSQTDLQYRVFCSTSATAMLTDALPSGTNVGEVTYGWTQNLTSAYLTLAMPVTTTVSSSVIVVPVVTTLYYNVYVRNSDGTIKAYSQYTYTPVPVPGSAGVLTATPKAAKKVDLLWTKATDVQTPQSSLLYRVYSSQASDVYSAYNTVATYSAAVAGVASGIAVLQADWTTDINSIELNMGVKDITFYFNVFVMDGDGNISPYVPASATTTN